MLLSLGGLFRACVRCVYVCLCVDYAQGEVKGKSEILVGRFFRVDLAWP